MYLENPETVLYNGQIMDGHLSKNLKGLSSSNL